MHLSHPPKFWQGLTTVAERIDLQTDPRTKDRHARIQNYDFINQELDEKFKTAARDRYIVVSVTFRLRRNGAATVKYPELRNYLEERGAELEDLQEVRNAVIAIRRRKGMVLDATDPDTRSDGSFFMNF